MKAPIGTTLGLLWVVVTALFFLGVSALILIQPGFPLALGILRTTGRIGLWVTLLPALVGVFGLVWWRRTRLGPGLVTAYSVFWFLVLRSGLPYVLNAKQSFCLKSLDFCITTPWLGRLAVLAVAAPFLFTGVWSAKILRRTRAPVESRITAAGSQHPQPDGSDSMMRSLP